jgi:hypothetical protein
MREGAKCYSLDILKKKYFLNKGILFESLNKPIDAQDAYLDCMETGLSFDPKIRKECIERLINLQNLQGRKDMLSRLENLLD